MAIPSLCFLRVQISAELFQHVLTSIWGDCIDHIDVVDNTDYQGRSYHIMFVHFKDVEPCEFLKTCLDQIELKKRIELIYDDPYYWTVCKNNTRKKTDEELAREEEIETAMYEFQAKVEAWEVSDEAEKLWREYFHNTQLLNLESVIYTDDLCKLQNDFMKKCDKKKLKFARKIIKEIYTVKN